MDSGSCSPTNYVWTHQETFRNRKAELPLQGHSVSSRESGFYIEKWKILLDAGINCQFEPEHIFITHTHSDHAQQLAAILTGNYKQPTVYAPKGTIDFLKNLIVVKQQMTKCNPKINWDDVSYRCKFVECEAGQDPIDIKVGKNKTLSVEFLATEHRIPSIGFAFSEYRNRLKPEFRGLPGKDLALKNQQGFVLTEPYLAPIFMYLGDSTPRWMALNQPILDRRFPFIICECTFVTNLENNAKSKTNPQITRAKEAADQHTHTCWQDLGPLIKTHNEQSDLKTLFILVHWSKRYRQKEIEQFFAGVDQVITWTW